MYRLVCIHENLLVFVAVSAGSGPDVNASIR